MLPSSPPAPSKGDGADFFPPVDGSVTRARQVSNQDSTSSGRLLRDSCSRCPLIVFTSASCREIAFFSSSERLSLPLVFSFTFRRLSSARATLRFPTTFMSEIERRILARG